jgi:hypothetical protein
VINADEAVSLGIELAATVFGTVLEDVFFVSICGVRTFLASDSSEIDRNFMLATRHDTKINFLLAVFNISMSDPDLENLQNSLTLSISLQHFSFSSLATKLRAPGDLDSISSRSDFARIKCDAPKYRFQDHRHSTL